MKKLIATLAVLAMAPAAFAANGEFSHSAEYRARHTTNMQDVAFANDSHMDHRLMLNLDYRSGEKFSGHLGLIHYSQWGNDNTGAKFFGSTTSADDNMLVVNQAYASWMVSDDSAIKVGRMPIIIADGRVFGKNSYYGNQPVAFSAFNYSYDTEFANMAFFAVKLSDKVTKTLRSSFGSEDPESNAYAFNFDFKSLPEFLKMANFHVIQVATNEGTVDDGDASTTDDNSAAKNQLRYGLTLGGDSMGIDYNLTYASIGGDTTAFGTTTKTDYASTMMDFTVGYTLASFMNSRFYLNYHTDSGTSSSAAGNETYDGFYYSAHAYAGLMDIMKWGNLTDTSLNWTFESGKMNFAFNYHIFAATEKEDVSTNGGAADAEKTDIGTEIDFKATHKYSDSFKISALFGQFSSGERLTGTGTIADKQKLTLEGTWTF
ncbi:MAG: hypothetical protein HOO06_01820 [Bdellovibrionaceae bacterium]|nr:hypothetical protein [Pseudobdellovibrionaceae bacterium]